MLVHKNMKTLIIYFECFTRDLSDNQLTSIPKSIFLLPNLKQLNMSLQTLWNVYVNPKRMEFLQSLSTLIMTSKVTAACRENRTSLSWKENTSLEFCYRASPAKAAMINNATERPMDNAGGISSDRQIPGPDHANDTATIFIMGAVALLSIGIGLYILIFHLPRHRRKYRMQHGDNPACRLSSLDTSSMAARMNTKTTDTSLENNHAYGLLEDDHAKNMVTHQQPYITATSSMRRLHHDIQARDISTILMSGDIANLDEDKSIGPIVMSHPYFSLHVATYQKQHTVLLHRVKPMTNEACRRLLSFLPTLRHPRLLATYGVVWHSLDHVNAWTKSIAPDHLQLDIVSEFTNDISTLEVVLGSHSSICTSQCSMSSSSRGKGNNNNNNNNTNNSPISPLNWHDGKLAMARDIALALKEIHEHDKMYQGLTGKTVLVDSVYGCKLITLALAFDCPIYPEQDHDAASRVFLAPEILQGEAPTAAADMYAFGMLLIQMDLDAARPELRNRRQSTSERMECSGTMDTSEDMTDICFGDAPDVIKTLAKACLHGDPRQRPSASFAYAMMARKELVVE